jgi:hypothetical protein
VLARYLDQGLCAGVGRVLRQRGRAQRISHPGADTRVEQFSRSHASGHLRCCKFCAKRGSAIVPVSGLELELRP